MRVAVTQFATSSNPQKSRMNCIRLINEAAKCQPSIIVLPEYCNTLFMEAQSCYVDHNQAWNEALTLNGDFVVAVTEQAKQHHCYIVLNATIRQDSSREHQDGDIKSNISVTSCLIAPSGEIIHQVDKQALTAYEKKFFMKPTNKPRPISTAIAKVGLISGSDMSSFKCPQTLSNQGANLLCHSMNTFALDDSDIHIPARAFENKVFIAAANKVGALMPDEHIAIFSQQHEIPKTSLQGIGLSQIIAPDGRVLAQLSHQEEGVIFADIELEEAEEKFRPDGSDIIAQRRAELYQTITKNPTTYENVPVTANVAIYATYTEYEQAIDDVCHYIENNLSDIIQLPELFFISDKTTVNDSEQLKALALISEQLVARIAKQLRPFQYVCTSVVIEGEHRAVLISEQGVIASQAQLHFCQRYPWTPLGDEVNVVDVPLEQGIIKLAMLTADDANIPELVNFVASKGIQLLLMPFDIQEANEATHALISRAMEHRICIVAATREKSLGNHSPHINKENIIGNKKKIKAPKSTGLIINVVAETSILPQWQQRKFNGYINQTVIKHQHGKITKAVIHPVAAGKNM